MSSSRQVLLSSSLSACRARLLDHARCHDFAVAVLDAAVEDAPAPVVWAELTVAVVVSSPGAAAVPPVQPAVVQAEPAGLSAAAAESPACPVREAPAGAVVVALAVAASLREPAVSSAPVVSVAVENRAGLRRHFSADHENQAAVVALAVVVERPAAAAVLLVAAVVQSVVAILADTAAACRTAIFHPAAAGVFGAEHRSAAAPA